MPNDRGDADESPYPSFKHVLHMREGLAILAFVEAKRTARVISDAHAREIVALQTDLFRQNGMLEEQVGERALHRHDETMSLVSVTRQANESMKARLLELYPQLAGEIGNLLASDRGR
jgi:hypothetical protein